MESRQAGEGGQPRLGSGSPLSYKGKANLLQPLGGQPKSIAQSAESEPRVQFKPEAGFGITPPPKELPMPYPASGLAAARAAPAWDVGVPEVMVKLFEQVTTWFPQVMRVRLT